MEGAAQLALPILGIAAAAAVTFYVVSFSEMREKSFKDFEEEEEEEDSGGFRSSASSRQRRATRKAEKKNKSK